MTPPAFATVAALYVDRLGPYPKMPGVEVWDEARDARLYAGPWPVVAHPPCQLWGPFAAINFKRWGGEHNRPGNDGGCFEAALNAVRKWGGVLEHPAFSKAWSGYGLARPGIGWTWDSVFHSMGMRSLAKRLRSQGQKTYVDRCTLMRKQSRHPLDGSGGTVRISAAFTTSAGKHGISRRSGNAQLRPPRPPSPSGW